MRTAVSDYFHLRGRDWKKKSAWKKWNMLPVGLAGFSPPWYSGRAAAAMRFAVLEALGEGRAHETAEQNESHLLPGILCLLHHARNHLSSPPVLPSKPDEETGKIIVCVCAFGIWVSRRARRQVNGILSRMFEHNKQRIRIFCPEKFIYLQNNF